MGSATKTSISTLLFVQDPRLFSSLKAGACLKMPIAKRSTTTLSLAFDAKMDFSCSQMENVGGTAALSGTLAMFAWKLFMGIHWIPLAIFRSRIQLTVSDTTPQPRFVRSVPALPKNWLLAPKII